MGVAAVRRSGACLEQREIAKNTAICCKYRGAGEGGEGVSRSELKRVMNSYKTLSLDEQNEFWREIAGGGQINNQLSTPTTRAVITLDENYAEGAFLAGYETSTAVNHIWQLRIVLYSTIEQVTTAIIATQGLPEHLRARQLLNFAQKREDGVSYEKRLGDACYDLNGATEDFPKKYPNFPLERWSRPDDDAYYIILANDYAGALRRLVTNDVGSVNALDKIFDANAAEVARKKLRFMQDNALRMGRKPGVDMVTLAIGEHAIEATKRFGEKWKMIGEEHYKELKQHEHPSDLERKVMARYAKHGYLARNGVMLFRRGLSDTVQDAVTAVRRQQS